MLFHAHMSVANFTKIREIELERNEAERLSVAAANVARWYAVPTLAQKTLDWIALASVAFGLYSPRVVGYQLRASLEKAARREHAQRTAAAREGVPTVQRNGMAEPARDAARPAAGVVASRTPAARGKTPAYSADVGLSLETGDVGISNAPLAMIIPDGGFTN